MRLLTVSAVLSLFAAPAQAESPIVAVDIAPLHSLVAGVMQDIGTPKLILPAATNPHSMALRPSQAQELQGADVVIWIGPQLLPGFKDMITSLAPNAISLPLAEEDDYDDHGHDDHGDHPHDKHDSHGHNDHAHGHDHDHDPHAWLDPETSREWVHHIAQTLAVADPAHAAQYASNAKDTLARIDAAEAQAIEILASAQGIPMLQEHDSLSLFAEHFGLIMAGSITGVDDLPPSAQHLQELQHQAEDITCVLAEAGSDLRMARTVFGDKDFTARTVLPMGDGQNLGPQYWGHTINDLARAIADCVAG